MSDELLDQIINNLYQGEDKEVAALVQQALEAGFEPQVVLRDGLIAGMDVVGPDFKSGVLFVPEVLLAARAMQAGMSVLRPLLIEGEMPRAGKFVIGTVRGDLHDIGKNLVKMMLEGAGFEVVDLGTDTEPEIFVDAIREQEPDIVGMSALLTTTMVEMKRTIDVIAAAGVRERVKIMVGGAPVSEAFSAEIGADAYAPDAATAVERARELARRKA